MRAWLGLLLLLLALPLVACGPGTPAEAPAAAPSEEFSPTSAKPKAVPSRGKQPPPAVHFTAAGDFDNTSHTDAVLRTIKTLNSDFTLAVGDLSYGSRGTEKAWCDYVTSHLGRNYPFELLAGNHESNGQDGFIDAFASCLPNRLPGLVGTYGRRYYVDVPADKPLVRLISISPGLRFPEGKTDYRSGSAEYTWTARAIDSARKESIPWVVVGMHHPCITVGIYGCGSGSDVFNLLLAKRVDLIFSGHDHSYQRSKQLALSDRCRSIKLDATEPNCVAGSGSRLTKGAGSVAIVAGTGGRHLYDVYDADPEEGYFATFLGANHHPSYGVVSVTATSKMLRVSFVRASDGSRHDSFLITATSR